MYVLFARFDRGSERFLALLADFARFIGMSSPLHCPLGLLTPRRQVVGSHIGSHLYGRQSEQLMFPFTAQERPETYGIPEPVDVRDHRATGEPQPYTVRRDAAFILCSPRLWIELFALGEVRRGQESLPALAYHLAHDAAALVTKNAVLDIPAQNLVPNYPGSIPSAHDGSFPK
jgi:hypothetical protein